MKMCNVSQLKSIKFENSLFSHIDKFYKLDIETDILDSMLMADFGNKPISPILTIYVNDNGEVKDSDVDIVAKIAVATFKNYWDRLKLVNSVKVDFENPCNMEISKQYSEENGGTEQNEHTEDNDLYGYDSADSTNVSKNNFNGSRNSTGNKTGTETETRKGHAEQISFNSMNKYVEMHKMDIIKGYLSSVGNFLTLPVWG